jgi:endonuclease YncB( thermonuclease family)
VKRKKNASKITMTDLLKKGVPAVLIPGILVALALGWNGGVLRNWDSWKNTQAVFPRQGIVKTIEDGDTFVLDTGRTVRLLGVNAPERGELGFESATEALSASITGKRVYLEYDRYQDDKFGRILAWAWVGCEKTPLFTPANYMHKSKNESNVGLVANPEGCKEGTLVNEELVKNGFAVPVTYADRGELKYEKRISNVLNKGI